MYINDSPDTDSINERVNMPGIIEDIYWCSDCKSECRQEVKGGGGTWRIVGDDQTTCRPTYLHTQHRMRENLTKHRQSSTTMSEETLASFRRSSITTNDVSALTLDHDRGIRIQHHHHATSNHNFGYTYPDTSSSSTSYASQIAEEANGVRIEDSTVTREGPRHVLNYLPLPNHEPKSTSSRTRGPGHTRGRNTKGTGASWVPVLLTLLGAIPALAREPVGSSVNSLGVYRVGRVVADGLFLLQNNTKVTAQAGATASLPCRLSSPIGDGMVSWVRRRHYQLLTIGRQVYSSDSRLGVKVSGDGREWTLSVRFVTKQDAGQYQCQVSSQPPTALTLHLQIVEAQAEIVGGPERYIHHGSSLLLVCLLKGATEPPVYVFWYRGARMINYDAEDGVEVDNSRRSSKLYISSVSGRDEGNYTCLPSNAAPASVVVTVIQKENPVGLLQNSNTENGGASSATSPKSSQSSPPKANSGGVGRHERPPWLSLLSLSLPALLSLSLPSLLTLSLLPDLSTLRSPYSFR